MEEFLDRFPGRSDAEMSWLREVFEFVKQQLGSAPDASLTEEAALDLSVSLLRRIEEIHNTCTLPLSYRLVSVSELVARQNVACVSNVSWSTNQHRAWVREAESEQAHHKALPRVHLLLIGYLREGRGGELRLTDASGDVTCQCVSPSPLWLDEPLFLPHWNYIPHNAPHMGLVELIGSPVLLSSGQGLAVHPVGAELSRADGVKEAAARLLTRCQGVRVQLCGVVCSVSPLLEISGTTFFILILKDPQNTQTLPVLVQETSCLWWSQCVCVDQCVYVTALRVCVVRGWKGNRLLCATSESKLHILTHTLSPHAHTTHTPQQHTETHTLAPHTHTTHTHQQHTETHTLSPHTHTPQQHTDTHTLSPHTHTPHTHHQNTETYTQLLGATQQKIEPNVIIQSGVRMKHSKVISYQGVVTEVLSEEAGLYMIDGEVGLCLAHQPPRRRCLRTGDHLQIHGVHFLYQPCPDLPPSMLCVCLRSTLRVTTFSPLATPEPSSPGYLSLPRLLLKEDVGVSQYLWISHVTKQLTRSLVPRWLTSHSVCAVAWRIMQCLFKRTGGGRRRDIYTEILEDPHTCPLSQYTADPLVCEYVCVRECLSVLESQCGSGASLRSLLLPDGASLSKAQLNQRLAWSHTARPGTRTRPLTPPQEQTSPGPDHTAPHQDQSSPAPTRGQRPLVLVGVLELPDQTDTPHTSPHSLQLRDGSGCVACVVTEPHEDRQRAVFNSAWIGCLVCVKRVTMVTEQFLQSDFPSYTHLEQDGYITHTHYRTYLQFCSSEVHILSPSVAMAMHLQAERAKREEEEERGEEEREKRVKLDGEQEERLPSSSQHPCVSVVMRVVQKEGVSWRNTGAQGEEAGLALGFLVRAELIGPALKWGRNPRNSLVTDEEMDSHVTKVQVVYQSRAVRWFPVLQPNYFYRIVVPNTQDPSLLIGSVATGESRVDLHTDPFLQVGCDWTFHTLALPNLLHSQCLSPSLMSVSELLDSSSAEMVWFQGVLSQRITLPKKANTGHTQSDVGDGLKLRLSMCDQSGRSVHVYLDLSHAPYPPGLLPGNTLLLSAFQRKLSRSGGVYCNSLPVSCVTVSQLGDSSPPQPSAPIMYLMDWMHAREKRCIVGRVRGHVVCVLFLQLNWSCSLCDSTFIQSRCSSPQCYSTIAVFQSTAKIILEDGTGEAHVWVSCPLVCPLLGLADSQWEELQRALRVRGRIRIYSRGRGLVCEDVSDCLLQYLNSLCSSSTVCRPLTLTCRVRTHTPHAEGEARRFSRGETDFMTRMFLPLQLTCTHIDRDSATDR
ncbi:unnamed protein product [Lota lota]